MEQLWVLVRVLLSLAIVLALAVVVLRYVLPRLMGLTPARGSRQRLRLLEALPLDRQHRVALLRAGDHEYLLGLGGGRVTAIDSWPAAEPPPTEPPAPTEHAESPR
jgi:flagellar biogenesis protein FliO